MFKVIFSGMPIRLEAPSQGQNHKKEQACGLDVSALKRYPVADHY